MADGWWTDTQASNKCAHAKNTWIFNICWLIPLQSILTRVSPLTISSAHDTDKECRVCNMSIIRPSHCEMHDASWLGQIHQPASFYYHMKPREPNMNLVMSWRVDSGTEQLCYWWDLGALDNNNTITMSINTLELLQASDYFILLQLCSENGLCHLITSISAHNQHLAARLTQRCTACLGVCPQHSTLYLKFTMSKGWKYRLQCLLCLLTVL